MCLVCSLMSHWQCISTNSHKPVPALFGVRKHGKYFIQSFTLERLDVIVLVLNV